MRGNPDDRLALQEAAQLAIDVEFTTIPAYLTGLYSISQPDSQAYQLLRSVVMEEMFHVNQAANILVAIGGLPRFTPPHVPSYPCYLPRANTKTTPFIGLFRASPDAFENVFAAIERPAAPHAPAEGDNYSTIAQLYEALNDGLEGYNGAPPLFTPNPAGRQRLDIYPGKFGGTPTHVTDLASAQLAIKQIVQQGEGSVPAGEPLVPLEKWGAFNHYGKRTDGTYGPIIGTPYEMSHFTKFRQVALDTANFPATYPIVSNAKIEDFSNPVAIRKAECFDIAYSLMLDALEQSFRHTPGEEPDPFYTRALPLMHHTMPNLALALMSTPTREDGDSAVGPNAAPTFIYRKGTEIADLCKCIDDVMGAACQRSAGEAELAPLARARDSMRHFANTRSYRSN